MSNILAVVMTYGERAKKISRIIDNIKNMSVQCDIVIINNSEEKIGIDGITELRGNNNLGCMQKFIPALFFNHKYFFYQDDDLKVGSSFVENAINIIEENSEFIVACGGSIITLPATDENIRNRRFFLGKDKKNKENIQVDILSSGSFVSLRENITSAFLLQPPEEYIEIGKIYGDELIFSLTHSIFNHGKIIVPAHNDPNFYGVQEFYEEHYHGKCSNSDFIKTRSDMLISMIKKYDWQPTAFFYQK